VTDTVGDRVHRYLLDGGDADLKRLLALSQVLAESARTALRRSGIAPGWTVVECGCGPLGALLQLAELTGAAGAVTGVDLNAAAVDRVRSTAGALALGNVTAVAGDIHDLGAGALGGPFDLAYTRLFLVHQPDPVRTLRHIASLLKPGGWLIAQESLRYPSPRSFPGLDKVAAAWQLLVDLVEGFGAQPGLVDTLPESAMAAGLEVVRVDGSFAVGPADVFFRLYASSLAAARERALAAGLTAAREIDALIAPLEAAAGGDYQWATSPFFLDVTLRKPA
jgi:SAM-dependent methyltransferase